VFLPAHADVSQGAKTTYREQQRSAAEQVHVAYNAAGMGPDMAVLLAQDVDSCLPCHTGHYSHIFNLAC
jgi:hypothetical protein